MKHRASAMRTSPFHIEWGRLKTMGVPLLELRVAAALLRMESGCALLTGVETLSVQSPQFIFGNYLKAPVKAIHTDILWPSNFTFMYILTEMHKCV